MVSAILAILAAILFPVFAQAREKARQTACLSNMKQMMLAAQQYTQDYDEKFPPDWEVPIDGYDDGVSQNGFTTDSALLPYAKNSEIFLCPDVDNHRVADWGSDITSTTDYGWNCYVLWGYVSLFSNIDPSRAGILTEIKDEHHYVFFPWLISSDDGLFNHTEGQHVGFIDGHAKWFSRETFRDGFRYDGLLKK